jgi:hypothetical protein
MQTNNGTSNGKGTVDRLKELLAQYETEARNSLINHHRALGAAVGVRQALQEMETIPVEE